MSSLFKSESAKKEILSLYEAKLASLNVKTTSSFVETGFGSTHILEAGNPENPPQLLVHGSNGCAPVALETYIELIDHFHVYAVDVLAQPNKSAENVLSMSDLSYGKWIIEVLDALKIDTIPMAGFSLGGLIILKTLEYADERISEVFLTAPAYIVNGNPLKAIFKMFIPMKRFIKTKNERLLNKVVNELFTEPDEFPFTYLGLVFQHFNMDFTPVPVIKEKAAKKIKTPITLIASQNDLIFPGEKMLKRAKNIFPSLKSGNLLADSKHVPDTQSNTLINQMIIDELIN